MNHHSESPKRALILGVANEYSIAWAITKALVQQQYEVILTYPNEAIKKRVDLLAATLPNPPAAILPYDAADPEQSQPLALAVQRCWPEGFQALVHAIAFAPKAELEGAFIKTTRQGFLSTLEISCYSLIDLLQAFEPLKLLQPQASVLTLTYYGSQKIIPSYNVMGVAKAALEASVRYLAQDLGPAYQVRINAISAGPIKTLAASGIAGFKDKLHLARERSLLPASPLTQEDVAQAALFLLSPQARAVTGQVVYVDQGLSCLGI